MSKCTRSLSLILILILSFSLFSVNAFAVDDENLIDSNLNNWVDLNDLSNIYTDIDIVYNSNSNLNYIIIPSTETVSLLYDLTDYITVGEKYVFRCYFPDTGNANYNSFQNCELSIGLVHIDDDGSVLDTVDDICFNITSANYSSLNNDYLEISFEINKSIKNTAVAFAFAPSFSSGMPESHFYISNIELVRVESESEKKLDGILGWLESIWDSITSLGDKLTDVWTNITNSVSALGDRISSFFSDLGNKITTEFTNLTSDFSGYISSLGDRFSGFITSLGDRISGYFENLSVNINAFFDDLLEGIKDFFRGFGNLILYFNWEGEYTNPFESSNSIIGGGSDGEDEEESVSFPIDLIQGNTSGWFYFTDYGDYYFFRKTSQSYGGYMKFKKIPLPRDTELSFSFDVSSSNIYNGSYGIWYFKVTSSYNTVSIPITGDGSYSVVLPSSPVDDEIEISVSLEYNPGDTYFNMNNFSCSVVSSNTGSDEDGTTDNVSVQGALDNILEYLSTVTTDIENVMDSITGSIELFDKFCEEFPFIKALCIFVLALLIYSTVIGL